VDETLATSTTGIDQYIEDHLVNHHPRLPKRLPEERNYRCACMTASFLADSLQNYDFSFKEAVEYIDIT
jgi:hypothetical protein